MSALPHPSPVCDLQATHAPKGFRFLSKVVRFFCSDLYPPPKARQSCRHQPNAIPLLPLLAKARLTSAALITKHSSCWSSRGGKAVPGKRHGRFQLVSTYIPVGFIKMQGRQDKTRQDRQADKTVGVSMMTSHISSHGGEEQKSLPWGRHHHRLNK